jgi:hypothetical protein
MKIPPRITFMGKALSILVFREDIPQEMADRFHMLEQSNWWQSFSPQLRRWVLKELSRFSYQTSALPSRKICSTVLDLLSILKHPSFGEPILEC